MHGKQARLPQPVRHAVAVFRLYEEALQPRGGNIHGDILRVDSRTRLDEDAVSEIRAEELHRQLESALVEELDERDGERIQLFAGGAPRRPNANGRAGVAALHQRGENGAAQRREGHGVAKETRGADREVLIESFDLHRVALEQRQVLLRVLHVMQSHAPPDAAADRSGFVAPEVGAARAA